jgi:hypothetical protein
MSAHASDETELVVVTSLSVLLNVVFGVIDLLIERKNIPRADVVELLRELKSEAKSHGRGEEMAIELLDGALYRLAKDRYPAEADMASAAAPASGCRPS